MKDLCDADSQHSRGVKFDQIGTYRAVDRTPPRFMRTASQSDAQTRVRIATVVKFELFFTLFFA